MPYDANAIRPNGIKRKLYMSPAMATETAGDYIAAYFPHGCNLIAIWYLPTVATGTAPSIIDIGVAADGETIIKDYSLSHTASVAGTAVDVGSGNLLLTQLPVATTVWVQSDGASTGGTGHFIFEYEDNNN